MSIRPLPLSFVYALFLSLTSAALATSAGPDPWREKVDPQLIGQSDVEFLIVLVEQADLSPARFLKTKEAKGEFVFRTLVAFADRSQGELLHELERLDAPHRSFWVANLIWARGGPELLETIAKRPEVSRLHTNPWVEMQRPSEDQEAESIQAIEWGVQMIGADDYWGLGFTGQGVVVAGQDTGYDWDHPALKDHYRGWDGLSANHAYNWHDAIHSGGGSCGADSLEPCDDSQHGTHTMGTMVGDDGGTNQIGVAPGARWIGCRNMNQGAGTPATYIECWQWFVAPTDLDDLNPDPSKAPHVVNNSWSCPPSEGCTDPEVMRTVVENVRAAGIVPVVSAGNSGPSCSTVRDPAAIYDASITIGSTTSADTISSFSSRGNVSIDGSGRMKPDVSAPGSSVRSSVPGGFYSVFSGTSMAGPHVAGQVALLISGNPERAGDVDGIELCLKSSAVPKTTTQICGGVAGTEVPNNTYGWGRVELPTSEAGAPSGLVAAPDGDNRISLTWSAGSGAQSYGVFRATNAVCPAASYELVASGIVGTSFTDTPVSGDLSYAYLVRSAEASGGCFSTSSACSSASTTGPAFVFIDGFESGDTSAWSSGF